MKSKYLTAILPVLSMTLLGHADQVDGTNPAKKTDEVHFMEYHNRVVVFAPNHQAYERLKTDAFYVGVEGYLVPVTSKNHNSLLDAELRMGYNYFCNGRDHFTPFLGAGYVQNFYEQHRHTYHRPGVVYGTVGFLYDHEFNTIFNLGFNAKFLLGGPVNEKRFDWGSPVVGVDASIPITFRFGHKRHWDYRIEPFKMYLHGSQASQNYFGFRNTLGYRF